MKATLTRDERIDEAIKCINSPSGRALFLELALRFPEASIFWEPEEPAAVLYTGEYTLTIS